MKSLKIFILVLFFSSKVYSTPKKLEIIFLSESTAFTFIELIKSPFVYSKSVAQVEFECAPMGDGGCFHPQYGYMENKDKKKTPFVEETAEDKKIKNFHSNDVQLIDCKKSHYFDIFCGKAVKEKKYKAKDQTEVWIDTSSSMRRIDYSKNVKNCYRQRYLKRLQKNCSKQNISFYTYDTSKKEIMDTSMACVNSGLNNTDRLIDWIKSSDVKHLVVVTDHNEMDAKLEEFLNESGAVIFGLGAKGLAAKDLLHDRKGRTFSKCL